MCVDVLAAYMSIPRVLNLPNAAALYLIQIPCCGDPNLKVVSIATS